MICNMLNNPKQWKPASDKFRDDRPGLDLEQFRQSDQKWVQVNYISTYLVAERNIKVQT